MKLVNANGGHSIGVFDPDKKCKDKVYNRIRTNRIKYFTPADYRKGSQLDALVKSIIDKTMTYEILEKYCEGNKREAETCLEKIVQ
jgi:hypothetical protein